MHDLELLLEQHGKLVDKAAKAWTKMTEAQEKARIAREAERESAQAIKKLINSKINRSFENPKFKEIELLS